MPQNSCIQTVEDSHTQEPADRERWAFGFSVEGDVRFISHRDMMRLFERALARAELPVRFTEGFNPHPRLSMPVPRTVGVASQAETVVIEFDRPIDGADATHRLNLQMPKDIRLTDARRLAPRERLLPELVRYRLEPPPGAETGTPVISNLTERIAAMVQADTLPIERKNAPGKQTRRIGVRPFLVELKKDGDAVEFTLRVTREGTARPREIAQLLGFDADTITHHIRRMAVQWLSDES